MTWAAPNPGGGDGPLAGAPCITLTGLWGDRNKQSDTDIRRESLTVVPEGFSVRTQRSYLRSTDLISRFCAGSMQSSMPPSARPEEQSQKVSSTNRFHGR